MVCFFMLTLLEANFNLRTVYLIRFFVFMLSSGLLVVYILLENKGRHISPQT